MIKKVLTLIAAAALYVQSVAFVQADALESSIERVVSNPVYYDGKYIVVEGEVEKVKHTTSGSGNPYTLFKLEGDDDKWLGVYSKGHLPISEGTKVKVMGKFKKEKRYAIFKFKNVIKAEEVEKVQKLSKR